MSTADPREEPSPAFAPGFVIVGRYRVERVLGEGGQFGLAYEGTDLHRGGRVVVKEYFPRELATRAQDRATAVPRTPDDAERLQQGLAAFGEEALAVARVRHANVMPITHYFEGHGTAYYVTPLHEGRTLGDHLRRVGGRLPWLTACELVIRMLDGLAAAHAQDVLHRDVKPGNVFLLADGRPILIDFGSARDAVRLRSRELTTLLTPGYAAFELYSRQGVQGPWTDVYACAALLYRTITGKRPTQAPLRFRQELPPPRILAPDILPAVDRAIMQGLAILATERPASARAFQDMLDAALQGRVVETPRPAMTT
jgi:serine/threonine protein kinase